MLKRTTLAKSLLLAFSGTAVMVGTPAFAQQTPQELQRVTVTGSNIKRTDTETASPVQVITRQDIEATGKQTMAEVLRGITADGLGSIPGSFSNGFASGSAAVSLRGLGVNSTLVLLNGRRMTTYGLADDGTRNFVDLNSFPLEAVDRIEVLKDGASAIYGADAVGGVVNVILRKDYKGAAIGGTLGQTNHSDGRAARAFGTVGFGDIETDKYNVFFTLEATQQKNILANDRGFIGQSDLRSLGYYDITNGAARPYLGAGPSSNSPYGVTRNAAGGGARVNVLPCTDKDPGTGLCRYNTYGNPDVEVQPETERLNLFGRGTLQISPALTAYAELGYFNSKSKSNGTLGANNDAGVYLPGDPFNPLVTHGFMTLPAAHPDNTFGVDRSLFIRPQELGGRDQKTNSEVFRVLAGLQGTAFDWDFDTGLMYVGSKLKNQNFGYIRYDVMQAALNNGTYRITSPSLTDPSVLASISPTLENTPTSSVTSLDFRANRELMKLDGGALGVAVGAEFRRETADTPPVPYTDTAQIVGLGYSAFNATRTVSAVFGEITAPVTKWMELSAAARYDHYSDFGNATTPKVGVKIKPFDALALRATYSEAFRAPGPAETGGSSFGFTTYGILSQGNPNIKPETAKSYTFGLIAEPGAGFSITADYWNIDRKNEIVQVDPALVIGSLPTSGTPLTKIPGAQPNSFIYYDADGNIGTITGFYGNASQTKTDGVDLEVRHRMSLGEAGKLLSQFNATHVNSFKRTDVNGNTLEYAGTHGPLSQSAGGGAPADRINFTMTWERGPIGITGAVNYVSPIKMVDHKGETTDSNGDGTMTNANTGVTYPDAGQYGCGAFDTAGNVYSKCQLPSFTTFDLFAKWTVVKNLDLNFSIQNLLDRKAPFDPYLAVPYGINYNQTWHQAGAVGRFFTVGAKYAF